MSDVPRPAGEEQIVYRGRIVEVVEQPMMVGGRMAVFEIARRSPGTRVIVDDGDRILLTEEYRHELGERDCRLPGGKVFDDVESYEAALDGEVDVDAAAREAAREEARQEAGVRVESVERVKRSHSGATVEWDLHYFVAEAFETGTQDLEPGEDIDTEWVAHDEVERRCLDGEIREDRTVAALLQYLDERDER